MCLDAAFAALYDPFMSGLERSGLGRWRSELLARATGDVLEIGAGTGVNLQHYPQGVRLTLTEPVEPMRRRLAERAGEHRVVGAAAEALPFGDASFDTVVSTLVLCSVADLTASLGEVMRVLRPGGQLLFIEHVGAPGGFTRTLQGAVEPAWKIVGRGCHLTRDTGAAIGRAGFEVDLDASDLPGGIGIVKAAVHGIARKPR